MQNPVLRREVGLIARNWRISLVLFLLVGLVGGVVLLSLAAASTGQAAGGLPTRTGVQLFSLLALIQLGLIILVAPGLTAGALSGERERRTLEPLWQTGLSATALALGKLGAAVAYLLLLLTAMTPAMGVLFLLGGAGLPQVALVYGVLVATGMLLSTLGLCASALSRRTQSAAAAAYILTAVLLVGSVLPAWMAGPALFAWGVKPEVFMAGAMANPVAALAASTGGPFFGPVLSAVLAPAVQAGTTSASSAERSSPFAGFVPPAYASLQPNTQTGAASALFRPPAPRVTYGYLTFAGLSALLMATVAVLAVRPPMGAGFIARRRARRGGGGDG